MLLLHVITVSVTAAVAAVAASAAGAVVSVADAAGCQSPERLVSKAQSQPFTLTPLPGKDQQSQITQASYVCIKRPLPPKQITNPITNRPTSQPTNQPTNQQQVMLQQNSRKFDMNSHRRISTSTNSTSTTRASTITATIATTATTTTATTNEKLPFA